MTTRNWHALGAIVLTTASLFAQDFSTVRLGQAAALGSMNNFSGGLHFFRWRNARLVAWDKDHQPTGRIGIYNSNAKLDLEKMVSFPIEHATDVSLVSADMARSGELVASGLATQQDGAVARFLARISPNGTVMKLVRTEPYLPQYICAADDGSVWTVGEEWLGPGSVKQSGCSVLRQYSFDKGLVREAVSREQFHGDRVSFGGPVWAAIIQCDHDAVHVYSDVTHQWFDYDTKTGALTTADTDPFSNEFTSPTGMVVTPNGRVLASIQNLQAVEGSRVFELGPKTRDGKRHWIALKGTECVPDISCIFDLLGIEDKHLIVSARYRGVTGVYDVPFIE